MKTEIPTTKSWHEFYSQSQSGARYPTEWVVRTLAGGNYPELQMPKDEYEGAKIIDLSCGDGRNLPLLMDLKFDVHATEISLPQVDQLKRKAEALKWPVKFHVAENGRLPFADQQFKFALACSSLYYLDGHTSWEDVRIETARIITDGGWLIGNIPDSQNAVLKDAEILPDGSAVVRNDPFSIRNGVRFMLADNAEEVRELLYPDFEVISVGHQMDDFYGLVVSGFFFVARKRQPGLSK